MPVTAKLSRRFYEQFGDEVTNELVNWFNAVDETYRNQLRELNELNWERFRSELRAEGLAIRSEVEKRLSEMDKKLDTRFAAVDAQFDAADIRFDAVDARFVAADARFAEMEAQFGLVKANFPALEQRIDAKFARCETRMYKAMFAFWTATIIPLAALILALDGVFQR